MLPVLDLGPHLDILVHRVAAVRLLSASATYLLSEQQGDIYMK